MFGIKKFDEERFTKLEQRIIILETQIEQLETKQNSLRGLVNRKINPVEELVEEEEIETNKKPSIFLNPNGDIIKSR